VLSNIVLAGGGFMFEGVAERLREELQARVGEPEYGYLRKEVVKSMRFANYQCPPNVVAWTGGKGQSPQAGSTTRSLKRSTKFCRYTTRKIGTST
jgi:actin-related protein